MSLWTSIFKTRLGVRLNPDSGTEFMHWGSAQNNGGVVREDGRRNSSDEKRVCMPDQLTGSGGTPVVGGGSGGAGGGSSSGAALESDDSRRWFLCVLRLEASYQSVTEWADECVGLGLPIKFFL